MVQGMALIDTVPTSKVTVPAFFANKGDINGELPPDWLRTWDEDGKMFRPVSYAFQALYLDAADHGVTLRMDSTGRYRTFQRQVDLQDERYSPTPIPHYSDTNFYLGHLWYLKPGNAMAAVPKTSNHGLGLADDVASDVNADNVPEGLSDKALVFLRDNAAKHGIGLETRKERWHWHHIGGNKLTQWTVDVLWKHGIAVPDLSYFGFTVPSPSGQPNTKPPTSTTDEDDMTGLRILTLSGYANAYLFGSGGSPQYLTGELYATYANAGVPVVQVAPTELALRSWGIDPATLVAK